MKFLVTGVGGQLGHDVMNELIKRGHEGIGSDIAPEYSGVKDNSAVTAAPYISLDITDDFSVNKVITSVNPDVVIHCAAWTAVDAAEDDENKNKAHSINADGTRNIAAACKKTDSKMIYISTDYVFDGQGSTHGSQTAKTINRSMFMAKLNLQASLLFPVQLKNILSSALRGFLDLTVKIL